LLCNTIAICAGEACVLLRKEGVSQGSESIAYPILELAVKTLANAPDTKI